MRQARKFASLPRADQRLLVLTFGLFAAVRLSLRVLTFHKTRQLLFHLSRVNDQGTTSEAQAQIQRIIWAASVMSRVVVPDKPCLTTALVAQTLLARQQYPTQLRIGVARSETGSLEAHAWLESEGQIIIGNLANLERYTPLPTLEPIS